jgi:hypothetical protein
MPSRTTASTAVGQVLAAMSAFHFIHAGLRASPARGGRWEDGQQAVGGDSYLLWAVEDTAPWLPRSNHGSVIGGCDLWSSGEMYVRRMDVACCMHAPRMECSVYTLVQPTRQARQARQPMLGTSRANGLHPPTMPSSPSAAIARQPAYCLGCLGCMGTAWAAPASHLAHLQKPVTRSSSCEHPSALPGQTLRARLLAQQL